MNLPEHVVIIPDGNRRWAKEKSRPFYFGHREGAKRVEEVIKSAFDLKIHCLTVWGCSVNNLKDRGEIEVSFLFRLFEKMFSKLIHSKTVFREKVKVDVLGKWREVFPRNLKKITEKVVEKTKNHDGSHLTFLMAYSGTDEMMKTVESISNLKAENPKLAVNEKLIKENLWTRELPPVDLVIRTGGEPHWSAGLMMWDIAEAQFYFTRVLWPDFSAEEFKKALNYYSKTERRFGK